MNTKTALSIFTFAPRFVQLGSVAALGLSLQGCVSARNYEEARSVAESETAAHGRTRARLEGAVKRIEELEGNLALQEKAFAERESEFAQSKLDTTVAQKEKEAAAQLVEQLRSELARTGDHLSSFSREKRDLQQTLLIAEQRMQSIENAGKNLGELVATTRDLALALEASLEAGSVELGAKDGQVVVSVPADKLFTGDSDSLLIDAAPTLSALGKVSAAHPGLRVFVREPKSDVVASGRARRLGEALRERGVPESQLALPQAEASLPALPSEAGDSAPDAGASDAENEPPSEKSAAKSSASAAGARAATAPATLPAGTASPRYEIAFGF